MTMQFDDLYDPNKNSYQNYTKTLDQIIRQAFNVLSMESHVCLPVKVSAVVNNSFVDVQPLLLTEFTNMDQPQTMPAIQGVPVSHPRGAGYQIKLPIAVGDTGFVIFSERSLDNWKSQGDFSSPDDARIHNLSDAIFVPGLYPMTSIAPGAATDLIVQNDTAEIALQKGGKFVIKNGENALLTLLSELADAVATIGGAVATLAPLVATIPGLSPPQIAEAIAAGSDASSAAGDAGTIKSGIDQMTGSV